MSHEFKNSIKSEVKYCVNCGCLSYKNIPAKNINLADSNTMKLDPLILKYRSIFTIFVFGKLIIIKLK